jgi:SAM-dependent methyltransferase
MSALTAAVRRAWRRRRRRAAGWSRYLRDWRTYSRLAQEPLVWADAFPRLDDRTRTAPFDRHYLHQAVWATRGIAAACPERHVDIGSETTYVALLAQRIDVTFVDIRPLEAAVPGLRCESGSLLALPFADRSIASLSSLHVIEHVGLGRYGDPLDPEGSHKAARELARVLAPGGNLYVSLPVGRPRVCFNAHRIHHPERVPEMFPGLELTGTAAVTDEGRFREGLEPAELTGQRYACGMYRFRRPERP